MVGQWRQRVERKPVRRFDFRRVRRDVAAGVVGKEGEHQRVGKGPGLAAEIAQVGDLDADFLAHLAHGALLDGFTRLHETRQCAENAGPEVRAAGEQEFVAPARAATAGMCILILSGFKNGNGDW